MMPADRDVRTVLLYTTDCWKRREAISSAERVRGGGEGQLYTSLDATQTLLIYPTPPTNNQRSWLQAVWDDRELAAKEAGPGLRCRPMHLVSEQAEAGAFWADENRPPFFLMTVVYGVNTQDKSSDEDGAKKENYGRATNEYEYVITQYLAEQKKLKSYDEKGLRYQVYNTIDVGDIVVLWFTSDICNGFREALSISQNGLARKTHTTLYFPLDADGGLANVVEKTLTPEAGATEEKTQDKFRLAIAGAIRCHEVFRKQLLPRLNCVLKSGDGSPEPLEYMLGRDDFQLLQSCAGEQEILAALQFFVQAAETQCVNDSKEPLCWSLRAYCSPKLEPQETQGRVPAVPTRLLNEAYRVYREQWLEKGKKEEEEKKKKEYPWAGGLRELLGIYAAMDSHPAFHGVGYLISDCIYVFNEFLQGKVNPYQDDQQLGKLLRYSEEEILRYVECLSQLADRLVRMDELTLSGTDGYSPIYGMLPENMLRFCYGFVRKFVDLLTKIDKSQGLETGGFNYGFLLFPGLDRKMKISQVLKTEVADWKNYLKGKSGNELHREENQIFPLKQLYLLEFPAENMYRPEIFFPQIFHECLHRFGDVLRLRKERKSYMAAYLAACAASWCGQEGKSAQALHSAIARRLYPDDEAENESSADRYLEIAKNDLGDKLAELFSLDGMGLAKLAKELNGEFSLYTNHMLRRWMAIAEKHGAEEMGEEGEELITSATRTCAYLFRECYADAMMIAFTNLRPQEYLLLMESELVKRNVEDYALIERIAIVLAAYVGVKSDQDTAKSEAIKAIKECLCLGEYGEECEIICLDLLNDSREKQADLDPKNYRPAAALRYVVDYIVETIHKKERIINNNDELRNFASDLKYKFYKIVKDKAFFGKEYYAIYDKEHKEAKERWKFWSNV